ncbi:MAG: rhomboid family intramembrane serine protease [Cyanobacteria bacterium QS_5_48_63]|nr:MAG: rhomboid family intramembrane serine protease [Cyanobacteria bacterium QS_5_48_63]
MNFNTLLIWIVCLSCIPLLLSAALSRRNQGWIVVSGSILVIAAVMSLLSYGVAGWVSGSLWLIFLLLPLVGWKRVNRLINQERYRKARRLAAYLRWLHPADGWLEQPQFLRALEMGQRGEIAEAFHILQSYQTQNTSMGRSAIASLYRMEARWEELLAWMHNQREKAWWEDSKLVVNYLRALGETGDLNGLLWGLVRCERNLEKTGNTVALNSVRMFALAFCGQTEQVRRLFKEPLAMYSDEMRQFWLATAEMAAGNQAVARKQLLAVRDRSDFPLYNAITWRLYQPPANPARVLTPSSRQIFFRVMSDIKEEDRYSGAISLTFKKTYATYGLIGLNIVAFAFELSLGGSQDIETLYRLGALVPEAVWAGEWWRLLSAIFLHFGYLHLLTNMLGLYLIGPYVELTLGIGRYLFAYLVSGVVSMLLFSILAINTGASSKILVGASVSIMSLIGVTGAILLRGWRQEKSRIAAKRLQMVLLIVGAQIIFDITIPQVSFLGHTTGLIVGFIIGNILLVKWRLRN